MNMHRVQLSCMMAAAAGALMLGAPGIAFGASDATTYYLISDLHIGGDGALDKCNFEPELIQFLRDIANRPIPAELIIPGDAFGLWETTEVKGEAKMERIIKNHPALFEQFRGTGRQVKITLLPGNHDYELACFPAFKKMLSAYNIQLEPVLHITRPVAGRRIWIEHGNEHDEFNSFPEFGDPYGMPPGYFITTSTVAAAGRSAGRGRSVWLNDLASVYPSEEIPFWIWSNYFYKEMGMVLRWFLLPFLLLFGVSLIIYAGQSLEKFGILRTKIFDIKLSTRFGLAGRLVDWVLWVNGVVISFVLILSIPLYLLTRDIRGALTRYGVDTSEKLKIDKEEKYITAAKAVFEKDPSVALYVYGHTHVPSLRKVGSRCVINTGTWLKQLERTPARFRLMPDVYVPSYHLSCFTISPQDGDIRVAYRTIPKAVPDELTLLQKLMILGRRRPGVRQIPEETILEGNNGSAGR